MKDNIIEKIEEIIESDIFLRKMEQINYNYPNLKQEIVIRNTVLELFNEKYKHTDYRAFAEYPRDKKVRFDLSIVKKINGNSVDGDNVFKTEFKFFFTNDKRGDGYQGNLQRIFERKPDLYVLVVTDLDKIKKEMFDKDWNIKTSLSKYVSENDAWKEGLNKFVALKSEDRSKKYSCNLYKSIEINEPYRTTYHFYLITENKQ